MNLVHTALWGVLPYPVLTLAVAGSLWRYRYDRFGFTTRSTQLHEARLLSVAGPLFHYGLFLVALGHIAGLLVPEWLTERLRISERLYHLNALLVGGAAGLATAAGLGLLIWRRLRVPAVRRTTSRSDRLLHPLLALVLLAGLTATAGGINAHPYDYRRGVSLWFRSLFTLDPDVSAMAHAPLVYRVHALLAMALFALWPFSRLVHAFTAPLGYVVRPYVLYRSRAPRPAAVSRRAAGHRPHRWGASARSGR
ncbi:respiratory nitrate reductase subunit gamma [Streptomyces orinoci]|uniref:Respiratory nitrate reductase subunit gamma n=1 Tax=Streptomyces orinoci TaxID=67339 RepID=A0ABV3JZ05_STRON|nr:respiratory nitrate reductase subunit gamma [Streptomyces orinoci]